MLITVKFFAILRDRAGISETIIELPSADTVAQAAESIARRFPDLKSFLPRIAYAVNEEYVAANTELHDGDELALIPPVSGGSDG